MSINSIDHDEMATMAHKWEEDDDSQDLTSERKPSSDSAAARRRIEALRDIRESGLSIEEAKELGLLH